MVIYSRFIEPLLTGSCSRNKVRMILGARQTGKTSLLIKLLPGPDSLIFNLQDLKLRQQFEANPSSFREELAVLDKGIVNIGIDEIQKAPALLDEIQFLYDADPSRWQFYLTGSSARRLRTHSSNLLPGRCHNYSVYPIIRPEEAGFSDKNPMGIDVVNRENLFPARTLEHHLIYGSLPFLHKESAESAKATLQAYVQNYVEEEIRKEGLVRNVGAFHSFLRLAAAESGSQINLSKLSQESGVSASTLRLFYQVLADTFVGFWMNSYGDSGRKRLLKTPRFYFFDLGVRNAAAGVPMELGLTEEMGGRLLEHWVGLELLHRAGYLIASHVEVTFWRTSGGAEVDFVWQTPDEHIPIEVKWTSNPQTRDIRHLETFLDLYPAKAHRGFLVCRAERRRQLSKRVTAIPWSEI